MVSTMSKAVAAGMACGALGLGLGALWASENPQAALEPMKTMVRPGPIANLSKPESSAPAEGKATAVSAEGAEGTALGLANQPAKAPVGAGSTAKSNPAPPSEPLAIRRLVVTNRIEGREPVRVSEFSTNGDEVFAFVELSNASARERRIEIVFEHESGHEVGFVKLPVPKDKTRWRTWGQTRQIKKSGRWVAKVRDDSGTELLRRSFVVGQG